MKCRICGEDCPPGARICRDCAAARKRAFAATVTQPLLAAVGAPSVGEPRFAPKPVRRRAANDAAVERALPRSEPGAALPLNVVPRKLGVFWLFVAAMVATAAVLILSRTMGNGSRTSDESTPAATAVPVIVLPTPAASVTESAPAAPMSEAPVAKILPARTQHKAAPRNEAASTTVPAPATVTEPAPDARPPTLAPRAVETPRSDPWQALNEGLSRCGREGLFDRIACEQRLRSQYCGNSWGVVPQCPIGPSTDHGQ
jgi:hypothetical protein